MNFIKEDMKLLSLSHGQKDRLLEMFNKINPKYKSVEITATGLICYSKTGKFPCSTIHWLEFCNLHVFTSVRNLYDSGHLSDFYYVTIGYNFKQNGSKIWDSKRFIHPVDYLYEHFKKLK